MFKYVPMQQNTFFQDNTTPESVRGIRTLEERYNGVVRRIQLLEQNMLNSNKKTLSEIKALNSEIADIKKQIEEVNGKIELIAKEFQTLAKKEEVDVLKKYLNLWEPVNFVTQTEVEKIVKNLIEEAGAKNSKQ